MQAQLHPISAPPRRYATDGNAEREHAAHVARLQELSAQLEERQKGVNRDLHWGRKGPVPQEWAFYDTERRCMPQPYGGGLGPAYASAEDSELLAVPWNRPLDGDTMQQLIDSAEAHSIDLRNTFTQYANGAEMMSHQRFHTFAFDAMLLQDSADVNGFFEMALHTNYQASLKIGFDSFMAALCRIITNLSVTQGHSTQKCADLVMEYHIGPTVTSGREFYYYAKGQRFRGGSTAPGRSAPVRHNTGRSSRGVHRTGFHYAPVQ